MKDRDVPMKIYEKPVMTKFCKVNGVEFELGALLCCIDEILTTHDDDKYGDYSLRDYELSHQEEMDRLVDMGLVKYYIGSRMAKLYCVKDRKGLEDLRTEIYDKDV